MDHRLQTDDHTENSTNKVVTVYLSSPEDDEDTDLVESAKNNNSEGDQYRDHDGHIDPHNIDHYDPHDPKNSHSHFSLEHYLGCGFYQALHFVLSQLITVAHAFNMTMMAFGKIRPQWRCLDNVNDNDTSSSSSSSFTLWNHSSSSLEFTCQDFDARGCRNLTMETEFVSVVYEWKLFCGGMKMVFLSLTLQMVGVVIGSQIWGQLADWYGRKWVLFAALLGLITSGIGSIFSPDITVFCVFRFIIGFFVAGTVGTTHVYMNEFIISKHRLWVGCINTWALPQMLVAIVAWIVRDWKQLTIICNAIAIPALLILCFMKDSPSWLIQKGRYKAAEKSINNVMKMNKVSSSCTGGQTMENKVDNFDCSKMARQRNNNNKKKYSFWHLYTTRSMMAQTSVLSFVFFVMSVVSYGIIFDTDNFAGDTFMNFFLFALLKFIASCLTIVADVCIKSAGRKAIYFVSMLIMMVSCCAICLFKMIGLAKTMVETVVSMIAIMITSPIWTAIVLSATEIYPTPIRNVAMGYISAFSRIGAAVSPQILYLASLWTPSTYLIYGVLCLAALVLHMTYIPETKGAKLPEHMPDDDDKKVANKTRPLLTNGENE